MNDAHLKLVQGGDRALREAAQSVHCRLCRRVARARQAVSVHRAARARHRAGAAAQGEAVAVLKVKLMIDMAHALAFLHENGVLYRDLKTENLLVFSVSHTAPVNCKLADFGSAIAVTDPSTPLEHSRHVGTPIYMAPEVMNSEPYMSAIDIYSLAIIMWELLAEMQPYAQVKRLWELPKLVLEGARPALQEWDEELCELISRCWLHTPTRRPSAHCARARIRAAAQEVRGVAPHRGGPRRQDARRAATAQSHRSHRTARSDHRNGRAAEGGRTGPPADGREQSRPRRRPRD
jgi:hypothetical protein